MQKKYFIKKSAAFICNRKRKFKKISLQKEAAVTSGNYEKFALIGDKKYGHIIHPKTGRSSSEIISVTVKGSNAVIANFLSTTIMRTSPKKKRKLQRAFPSYRVWVQRRKTSADH